jgi:hypothetical protein
MTYRLLKDDGFTDDRFSSHHLYAYAAVFPDIVNEFNM